MVCQGLDHDARTCSAKKAFGRLIAGPEKVRECVMQLPRDVQVMPLDCPLIPMLANEEAIVQLLAVASMTSSRAASCAALPPSAFVALVPLDASVLHRATFSAGATT